MKMGLFLFILSLVFAHPQAWGQIYYPLEVGTRWSYLDGWIQPSTPREDAVVGDTTMENGKTYRVIQQGSGTFASFVYYLRREEQKIYQYRAGDSLHPENEFVRFDFSKKAGDTVDVFSRYTIISDVQGIQTVLGKVRRYHSFHWSASGGYWGMVSRDEQVGDSLGILNFEEKYGGEVPFPLSL